MAATGQESPARKMADALFRTEGTTLESVLTDGRERGLSYERIAREIHARTDGVIDVSSSTLRNWHLAMLDGAGDAA